MHTRVHYKTETVIAPSECTTLKMHCQGKCVLNYLFLVTTFNQAKCVEFHTSDSSCTLFVKRYDLATFKAVLA